MAVPADVDYGFIALDDDCILSWYTTRGGVLESALSRAVEMCLSSRERERGIADLCAKIDKLPQYLAAALAPRCAALKALSSSDPACGSVRDWISLLSPLSRLAAGASAVVYGDCWQPAAALSLVGASRVAAYLANPDAADALLEACRHLPCRVFVKGGAKSADAMAAADLLLAACLNGCPDNLSKAKQYKLVCVASRGPVKWARKISEYGSVSLYCASNF